MDKETLEKVTLQVMYPLVASGEVDPAFEFACLRSDYQCAHPWRCNNVAIIDRTEMNLRQCQWNSFVDEYVACRDAPTPLCAHRKEAEGSEMTSGTYRGRKIVKEVGRCRQRNHGAMLTGFPPPTGAGGPVMLTGFPPPTWAGGHQPSRHPVNRVVMRN
jgi:hypothetical protein